MPSLKDGVTVAIAGTTPVSIRLADDLLAHDRAGGGDWEARINASAKQRGSRGRFLLLRQREKGHAVEA